MEKKWIFNETDQDLVDNIVRILRCSRTVAKIVVNRGYKNTEDVFGFLNPSFSCLKDPNSIKDIGKASKRIYESIMNNEKIIIFGDYDADGITSTVILYEFLKESKSSVSYFIPHRKKDGYGLKSDFVETCDADLIITVDNGITSNDAVDCANTKGIDVIICDHHDVPEDIPNAYAVVNPKREDCKSGLTYLAGVGVTYYLLIVLRQYLREKGFYKNIKEPNLKNACDMVAIGTVADIVPMINENRVLVKTGFEIISQKRRNGVKSLLNSCKIKHDVMNSDDIGFKIAPKINAAGRIDHGKICVELFLTNDSNRSDEISKNLIDLNSQRQSIEKETEKEILEIIKTNNISNNSSIILSAPNWHSGILGIVASKIVSKFFKPVVLLEENGGISKGSGRSIKGINMYEGFKENKNLIELFGGHEMAAGLSIKTENIGIFSKKFDEYAEKIIKSSNLQPTIEIDCYLEFSEIDGRLLEELNLVEPCGTINKAPVFKSDNIEVISCVTVGKNHKKMNLRQTSGTKQDFKAILFNDDILNNKINFISSIVYNIGWNYWNGSRSIQIIIEDYKL